MLTEQEIGVLNRWDSGEGAGSIAKAHGRDAAWVRKVVRKARQIGDPRAVSHADAVAGTAKWRARYSRGANGWEFRA